METTALKALARRSILCAATAALACAATAGLATDRDGKRVVIPKSGERCVNDPKCHNRWHYAIPRVASADPGDVHQEPRASRWVEAVRDEDPVGVRLRGHGRDVAEANGVGAGLVEDLAPDR